MRVALVNNGVVTDIYEVSQEWADAHGGIPAPTASIGWVYNEAAKTFFPPTIDPIAERAKLVISAKGELSSTDTTVLRIQEAISLGILTSTTPSVVAFMAYRKELRAIISGVDIASVSLPFKPAYPAGT